MALKKLNRLARFVFVSRVRARVDLTVTFTVLGCLASEDLF